MRRRHERQGRWSVEDDEALRWSCTTLAVQSDVLLGRERTLCGWDVCPRCDVGHGWGGGVKFRGELGLGGLQEGSMPAKSEPRGRVSAETPAKVGSAAMPSYRLLARLKHEGDGVSTPK